MITPSSQVSRTTVSIFRPIHLIALAAAMGAMPLQSATYTVTHTGSLGAGSLRQAVLDAEANPGPDIIEFAPELAGQTIWLAHVGDSGNAFSALGINTEIEIRNTTGSNITIARDSSSGYAMRIFNIRASANLTLVNLTIEGGSLTVWGGGNIASAGTFTARGCTIKGGSVDYNTNPLTSGGGLLVTAGTTSLINCTITGNHSGGFAGGVASNADAILNVFHCTITGNSGGGIRDLVSAGTTVVRNTILGENSFTPASGSGNNMDATLALPAALAANGGPTETMALSVSSPAVDAGIHDPAVLTDQRGLARRNPPCIGAFELGPRPSLRVTTTVDEDDGFSDPALGTGTSLREALAYANSQPGADTITFAPALSGSTITLVNGQLVLTETGSANRTTIIAPTGGITISGGQTTRIFGVNSGVSATLDGLTLANGSADSGGAISNNGDLIVTNCLFRDNTASLVNGAGGAISHGGGTLDISNTVFHQNQAFLGGAINSSDGLTISDSTFSDNTAPFNGGALRLFGTSNISGSTFQGNQANNGGGGLISHGATTLTNTTFTGNSALDGGAFQAWEGTLNATHVTIAGNTATNSGGGLSVASAATTLTNTIVATNTAAASPDIAGTLVNTSQHNLIGTGGSGGLVDGVNGNRVGIANPGLATLADNGGPTETIALLDGSPALDGAMVATGIASDQRGISRGAAMVSGGLTGRFYNIPPEQVSTSLLSPLSNLEAYTPVATQLTARIDFGVGTEFAPGDGSVLDRNGAGGVGVFAGIGIDAIGQENVAAIWDGFIEVPETATYRFTTRSDDGSVLLIGGQLVVNNNFFQGMSNLSGGIFLIPGRHPIRIGYFQGGGGWGMQASWEQLDGANPFPRQIIPPERLFTGGGIHVGSGPDIGAFEARLAPVPTFGTGNITRLDTDAAFDLAAEVQASAAGGVFSGPGVSGGQFDPAIAGQGQHVITYTVIGPDGVGTSATFTITVIGQETPSLVVTIASNVVDSLDGQTSLREALAYAATLPGQPVITFSNTDANGATNFHDGMNRRIIVNNAEIVLDFDVRIVGPGASRLQIDSDYNNRVLRVESGAEVVLDGLQIKWGYVYVQTGDAEGGAIRNSGHLTLLHCAIEDSYVHSDEEGTRVRGGGIFNEGVLVMRGCALLGNSVSAWSAHAFSSGGGLYNAGTAYLANCTITQSYARNGGAIGNSGTLHLTNCTISDNESRAGAVVVTSGPLHLANTIIGDNLPQDLAGSVTSLGHNLVQNPTGATGLVASDITGVSPKLGDMSFNGGETRTRTLLPGSPAINAGSNALAIDPLTSAALATDQRGTGFDRIAIGTVDIGAYEVFLPLTGGGTPMRLGINDGLVDLAQTAPVHPPGGTFTGAHVTNGVFDPTGLTLGSTHEITYTISNTSGATENVVFTIEIATWSGLVVTTTADTTGGAQQSLRDVLDYAATQFGSVTVTFSNSTVGGATNFHDGTARAITLDGTELAIGGDVTIAGPGRDRLTISGNDVSRVFSIGAGFDVTLNDLTLTRGLAPPNEWNDVLGGAIYSDSPLTLNRCRVANNRATSLDLYAYLAGGAIYANESLTLNECLVTGNAIIGGEESNPYGGAIYANRLLIANDCTFSGNFAEGGPSSDGRAGAIYADDPAQITNCTFTGNFVRVGDDIGWGGSARAGALFLDDDLSVVSGCLFTGNFIEAGDSVSCRGAAIYIDRDDGLMTDTTITDNWITAGDGGSNRGAGIYQNGIWTFVNVEISDNHIEAGENSFNRGGGFYNVEPLVATMLRVNENSVTGGAGSENLGGGIANFDDISLEDSTIDGNSVSGGANNRGGGIYSERDLQLSRVAITRNSASGDAASTSQGGGLHALFENHRIFNSTIAGNTVGGAGGGQGAGIYNESPLTLVHVTIAENAALGSVELGSSGGGIFNNGTLALGNSLVAKNTSQGEAPDYAGEVTTQGHNLFGNSAGVITTLDSTDLQNLDPLLGSLQNNGGPTETLALLTGSPAIDTGGNALAVDQNGDPLTTDQRGTGFPRNFGVSVDIGAFEIGVAYESPSLIVTLATDTVDPLDNETSLREAVTYANLLSGPQTITFAPALGGQVVTLRDAWSNANDYDRGTALLILGNVTVQGPATGAGVTLQMDPTVERRHFLVNSGASLTLENLTLTGGKALLPGFTYGGSIWSFGSLTVRGCTFSGNQAGNEGGAIQCWGHSPLFLAENSTFSGNSSAVFAGAINAGAVEMTLRHITVTNNSATNGHAISFWGHPATLVNCLIAGNPDDGIGLANGATVTAQSTNNILGTGGSGGLVDGVNGNRVGIADPLLGTLAQNGGPTATVALLPGSPAVNAGVAISGITTDQRGTLRPQFGTTDIGAFEQTPTDNGQTIVTVGGASWYLGPDAVGGNLRIYREVPGEVPVWVDNGAATEIGQALDGTVLVRTSNGGVYARPGSTTGVGTYWQLLSGVHAGDGATWFFSSESFGSDFYIYRWAADGAPTYSVGYAAQLSVLADGSVLARTHLGESYLRIGSQAGIGSGWQLVNGSLMTWRVLHSLPIDGSQDFGNPSGDGVENLLKYAFNMAPNAANLLAPNLAILPENGTAGLPRITPDTQGRLVIQFIRRKAETNPGISYTVETGDDLGALQPLDLSGAVDESIDTQWERITVVDPVITSKRFGRLQITILQP